MELYDERFTTRLAQRAGGGASEDSRAAAILLGEWLAPESRVVSLFGGRDDRPGERTAQERERARLSARPAAATTSRSSRSSPARTRRRTTGSLMARRPQQCCRRPRR